MENVRTHAAGRGSCIRPLSRFDTIERINLELIDPDEDYLSAHSNPDTVFIPDRTKSIVSENDSPDVGFQFSLNPYRGCEHGCA